MLVAPGRTNAKSAIIMLLSLTLRRKLAVSVGRIRDGFGIQRFQGVAAPFMLILKEGTGASNAAKLFLDANSVNRPRTQIQMVLLSKLAGIKTYHLRGRQASMSGARSAELTCSQFNIR